MTKTTKTLLAISLTAFVLGFGDILGFINLLWGFGLPVGAIFFGWFMVFKILEKEMALYDQEQTLRVAEATRASKSSQRASVETRTVALSTAIAHSR